MKKILIIVAFLCLSSQLIPYVAQADDNMAYSVRAIIPDNQIDKTLTYFDLKMEPNQKQDIQLDVSNASDKEEIIVITPNNAKTNQNGVIDYSQSKGEDDSSLKIPLTSVISEAQEVTLAPNESKPVTFTLQMPDKEFDGQILGGFYIAKKENKDTTEESEKNVQIVNNYSYVIGIQLSGNTNEVKPSLKLNQIKPALLNYRTAVTANIQNIEATKIKDLSVDAKVMRKGNSDVLHEIVKENLSMAPNSNFDFPISWDNQALEAGTYTLKLTAKSGEDEWEFEKDFDISAKGSNLLNKEAVELEKSPTNWLLIILIVVSNFIILMGVIFYFINRRKKRLAAEKRARLARKRKRQAQTRKVKAKKIK